MNLKPLKNPQKQKKPKPAGSRTLDMTKQHSPSLTYRNTSHKPKPPTD
jgi:hypothetical protein